MKATRLLVPALAPALLALACGSSKNPEMPSAPPSGSGSPASASASAPGSSGAPSGPAAGAWYADSCERAGPASCDFKDPIETPSTTIPKCSAIGAEAGRPCRSERDRCELVPGQRDRLGPCTLPARHLTCLKKAPGRVC